MSEALLAGRAAVWIQPNGLNTKAFYLGCHEIGEVTSPRGDVTLVYVPDRAVPGLYVPSGGYQGEPGAPSFTITTDLAPTADWLERLRVPATVLVHKQSGGRRDLYGNYERVFVAVNCRITQASLGSLAARSAAAEGVSTQTFNVVPERIYCIQRARCVRQTVPATADQILSDVVFRDERWGNWEIQSPQSVAQYGLACGDSGAGTARILVTHDGGVTWASIAADPFSAGESVDAVVVFQADAATTRFLVARTTADAGNPAEVAYSDDGGASWTAVDVGSVNGQYISTRGMFALDYYHIWLVTNDGYIYFSDDGGASWTEQEDGTLSGHLSRIQFADPLHGYAVGETNDILYTADGGDNWDVLTGPAGQAAVTIQALAVLSKRRVWIGYQDGSLFYTNDGGDTWNERTQLPVNATYIKDMKFVNDAVGYVAYIAGSEYGIMRTFDGGYNWEVIDVPLPSVVVNGLAVTDVNECYAVGGVDPTSGLAVLYKILPS